MTVTQSFTLDGEPRPVNEDVVEAMDAMLGRAGNVMHAIDPARLVSFVDGGPPVWSVGVVAVKTPQPYDYFLTYGFSHVLSPEPVREQIHHEFSIAVPAGTEKSQVWAVALLRHLARYCLTSGNELMAGDVMPFHGVPITWSPFPPQHHAMMPRTSLDCIVVTPDPVIPRIDTAHGPIEVRRIVGIDTRELQRLGPMPAAQRAAARAAIDPLFLTTI